MSGRLMELTVIVVDDEPLGRDMVRLRLAEHPNVRILAECGTGVDAIRAIRVRQPDVVFLDVRLPDMDGFEVVAGLRPPERPVVVFVTAHGELALRGFDARAAAYLVKPFDRAQFVSALDAALEQLAGRRAMRELPDSAASSPEEPRRWLVARERARTVLVRLADVRYVQADGDYARVHTRDRSHLIARSLTALEQELDGERFVRVHRSTIVNVECVRELRSEDGRDFDIVLDDGVRLRMSRTHRERLERVLRERL